MAPERCWLTWDRHTTLSSCSAWPSLGRSLRASSAGRKRNSDLISFMKGITGLIFKNVDAKYFYTGMRSALRVFMNLHQGEMTVAE